MVSSKVPVAAVSLWQLSRRQRSLLTYPVVDEAEANKRLIELSMLGVEKLSFEGPSEVHGEHIIAKGTVGIVLRGCAFGREVAVKVRRLDANRPSLLEEAEKLHLANSVGSGPRLLAASRNFLVWNYVKGLPLEKWFSRATSRELRQVVINLLRQALELDRIGLIHMELSRIGDHIVVTPELKAVIFDFETSSLGSRKSNVTQLIQGLFIRDSELSEKARSAFGVTKEDVLKAAKLYKETRREDAIAWLLA
ncbi:MAG: hypothetical protein N3E41_04075 [Thermofilaceae archaeon]|nr:hypothetical protein [Thermofilaceae archaeon]